MLFKLTWEEMALFLKIDKRHSQKPGAVQASHSRFNKLSQWFNDKEWNRSNIRSFLAEIEDRGLSQESLNKFVSLCKNIDEFLGTTEAEKFECRVPPLKRVEGVLSPTEIRSLATLKMPYKKYHDFLNTRQCALIMIMGSIGCRISELLELKWGNVKNSPRRHLLFVDTKNGNNREVPINDELWQLLMAIPRKGDLVFYSSRGVALRSGEINTDIKNRAKMIGINRRIYNHLFRHSWATTMKKMKVSDTDIARIAGWKNLDMLMRYDGSELDYVASKMELHPLMQDTMSDFDKVRKLVDEAELWFDPRKHKINQNIIGNKITLEIEPL